MSEDRRTGPDMPRMDLGEFVDEGYLQELNRTFLHPLGLALEVVVEDGVPVRLGGIWDCRDDPEGIVYAGHAADHLRAKADKMDRIRRARWKPRMDALGWVVQPLDGGQVDNVGAGGVRAE